MTQCPYCDYRIPGRLDREQRLYLEVEHTSKQHPDVIEQRLEAAGFKRDQEGNWIDTLADPGN